MNDTERETPVIFTWADREGSSWWLAVFIFLSFLLHSAAFFIFQGKDPAAPRTVRTAPVMQMLTPPGESAASTPEAAALLQWIATALTATSTLLRRSRCTKQFPTASRP